MHITLRQYLNEYHSSRGLKTPTSEKMITAGLGVSSTTEFDCQKLFHEKLNNLKKTIKKHLEDLQVYREVEKQLEQLRTIFYKNKQIGFSKQKPNLEETGFQKSRRYNKDNGDMTCTHTGGQTADKMSIPVIEINDEVFDDIKTVCMKVSPRKSEKSGNITSLKHIQVRAAEEGGRLEKSKRKTQPAQNQEILISNNLSVTSNLNGRKKQGHENEQSKQIHLINLYSPGNNINKNTKVYTISKANASSRALAHALPTYPQSCTNAKKQPREETRPVVSFPTNPRMRIIQSDIEVKASGHQKKQSDGCMPPTLEKRQSKYSQDQFDQIRNTRKSNTSKVSYAESKIFYNYK